MEPKVHLGKEVAFAFKTQPLQTISPQSSDITTYLAELTLEELNLVPSYNKLVEYIGSRIMLEPNLENLYENM